MVSEVTKTKVGAMTHPQYDAMVANWRKFRLVSEGGTAFINKYLKTFSQREDPNDFIIRKSISYAPSHAKAAVFDIKNSIFQRMSDITREGGTPSYEAAIKGQSKGVDLEGNTMNGFIGRKILPEMLFMGKVGIFVDRDPLPDKPTKAQTNASRPYIYHYATEDIFNWNYNRKNELTSVLLRDHVLETDPVTGLVSKQVEQFRLVRKNEETGLVDIKFFDTHGEQVGETQTIKLNVIPFVIAEVSFSLLEDIGDYQIALLNLASSDMNYAVRSNFPFYTEQFNSNSEFQYGRKAISRKHADLTPKEFSQPQSDGEAESASEGKGREINVGVTQGRRYAAKLDRPGFIHPSPEPLEASMAKQKNLQIEIRQLVNLNLSNIEPKRASAESKQEDSKGLEAGLSYIGMELEYAERKIARMWSAYEGETDPKIIISYPSNYSLRTDEDRRKEANALLDFIPKSASKSHQKHLMKQAITITAGQKVDAEELKVMKEEVDKSKVIVTDPEVIIKDHEAGLISDDLASKARLYPDGEAKRAQADKAKRAKAVLAAQTTPNAGARGVPDLSASPEEDARIEKEGNNLKET